jgi:hypothetical protein
MVAKPGIGIVFSAAVKADFLIVHVFVTSIQL